MSDRLSEEESRAFVQEVMDYFKGTKILVFAPNSESGEIECSEQDAEEALRSFP